MRKAYFPSIVLLLIACFVSCKESSVSDRSFEISEGNFVINGEPTLIISGEMHYSRIPHQYWRHRMEMLKAMGLNTVATYVFWNYHETQPGEWDFEGDKNLRQYIETAEEVGLHVILRPGPYACGEWEFGGYPWWLQNIDGLELRRDNAEFLKRTKIYIERLYKEIGDLQVTQGGPIIMVQAENEFGSYVAQRPDISLEEHRRYNAKIVKQLKDAGFDVPMFTSDGTWLFQGGSVRGALPTANGEDNIDNLRKAVDEYNNGMGPYMVAEFYTGWLAHWGEPHPQIEATRIARKTEEFLRNNISFNYYMVHGGTNFGFTSGANYDTRNDIQPDLTSYDYDAPINEAGWRTPKYDSLRSVIRKYVDYSLPSVPKQIQTIEIPSIALTKATDVLSMLRKGEKVSSDSPMTFEQLGQGYGYVLYSHKFQHPISGVLEIPGLRDYATVYLNGERIGILNRRDKKYSMDMEIPFNSTLEILVENMGRINYGSQINDNTKGIISPVTIGGRQITGNWEMYRLPLEKMPSSSDAPATDVYANTQSDAAHLKGLPIFYEGSFDLSKTGDTFLDMEGLGKGIVFVNGHNLGRYWKIGPQQRLYVPGVWLREGANSIVVFEQYNDQRVESLGSSKVPEINKLK